MARQSTTLPGRADISADGVRTIRESLEQHVLPLIEQVTGLTVSLGAATYEPGSNVCFKLKLAAQDGEGHVMTEDRRRFQRQCLHWGLQPSALDQVFQYHDDEFRVMGMTRGRKYPIQVERLRDGKTFVLSASAVWLALPPEHQVPRVTDELGLEGNRRWMDRL